MRRRLDQPKANGIAEQEARERQEIEEARQARQRLLALSREEQRTHPQGDMRTAADLVNEERGIRE
jgi:hypothetical protein